MLPSPLELLALFQDTAAPAPSDTGTPAEAPASPGFGMQFVPILIILGIFYLLLIRPERKKQKTRAAMLAAMKKGDRVMTTGGLYGTVAQVADDAIVLQVADGVRLRFNRAAIQTIETEETAAKADPSSKQEPQKA